MAFMRIYYGQTARGHECLVWEEQTRILDGTDPDWRMMQVSNGVVADHHSSHGIACTPPEFWLNWTIRPNFSVVPTAICAECQGPSFSDYLCARCRTCNV